MYSPFWSLVAQIQVPLEILRKSSRNPRAEDLVRVVEFCTWWLLLFLTQKAPNVGFRDIIAQMCVICPHFCLRSTVSRVLGFISPSILGKLPFWDQTVVNMCTLSEWTSRNLIIPYDLITHISHPYYLKCGTIKSIAPTCRSGRSDGCQNRGTARGRTCT